MSRSHGTTWTSLFQPRVLARRTVFSDFNRRTTWKVCNCSNSIVWALNLQVGLSGFSILSTLPWTAVPSGATVGTSGQQGREHKGLEGGRACRAAAAMVPKQKYLLLNCRGAPSKSTTALKISGFIPPFSSVNEAEWVCRWHVSSERLLSNIHNRIFSSGGDEVKVKTREAVWLRGPDSTGLFHRDVNERSPSIERISSESCSSVIYSTTSCKQTLCSSPRSSVAKDHPGEQSPNFSFPVCYQSSFTVCST